MLIKCIAGATRHLGAPPDWNGKDMSCGVLPVLDINTPEGPFMVSAWEPTPQELLALNKGASIELGIRGFAHPVVYLRAGANVVVDVKHPDDVAVDQFAVAMTEKLAQARAKGRGGWEQCDPAELSLMLREHVEKGDPRDVANFCMFLWSLGKPISDVAHHVPTVGFFKWLEEAQRDGFKFTKWDMEDAYRAGERDARAMSPAQPAAIRSAGLAAHEWDKSETGATCLKCGTVDWLNGDMPCQGAKPDDRKLAEVLRISAAITAAHTRMMSDDGEQGTAAAAEWHRLRNELGALVTSPTAAEVRREALEEARKQGIEDAERWVMARRDDFIAQHGSSDPQTGALEFGSGARGELKREYVAELDEIADGIISLADQPSAAAALQSTPAQQEGGAA